MSTSARKKKTILFLAANPQGSSPLRLNEELREIEEGLKRAEKRGKFQLKQEWAVRPRDMRRAILELKPQIVHFSGHGVGAGGLALEDDAGQIKLVDTEALASLFALFKDQVECVVLNACYSEIQAEAIVRHIPYVIGMRQEVGDQAAQEFAIGFYDGLGAGRSIEFSYQYGCTSIQFAGIPEHLTPVLKKQSDAASSQTSSTPLSVEETTSRKFILIETDSPQPAANTFQANTSQVDASQAIVESLELENPEGSVSLNSPLYIDRPPVESDCYAAVLKPGALIRVKAPRQMGKSSLMQRILHHSQQQGHQTAYLNFQSADAEFLSSIDLFLQWFCASVTNELNLDDRLPDFWKGVLGSKNKCTNYFQRYLLTNLTQPLTLGLDEVDQVFQHLEIAQDFFGLLRAWHERGKNEPLWQRLRLVIVHSKEVYIPLNINQSPFNVGLPIELPELNQTQVADLVQRHGLNWSIALVDQLMDVVGGHPYLVRKALYELARGHLTLNELVQVAPTEAGLFGDHLRRHLLNLTADPDLEAAMRQVIATDDAVRIEPSQAFKLRSMGLIELQGNEVMPLCNLYRTYLRDRLGVDA